MPHLTLEYSDNITQEINPLALFKDLHQVLNEVAGIDIGNIKSRAMQRSDFLIADGDARHAFVHLEIRLLAGRPEDLKQKIGGGCLHLLENYFKETASEFNLQITVEIVDILMRDYFKYPSGTLIHQK